VADAEAVVYGHWAVARNRLSADDAGSRRAILAVESRMYPLFVHDPRRGDTLAERFSLEGNPDIGKDWVMTTLDYIDEHNNPRLLEIPYTAADFAVQEGRFSKHFRPLEGDIAGDPVPIHEFIDLDETQRYGKIPFIWSTDANRRLVKLTMTHAIVALTMERRRNWRMLEYLGGLHIERMEDSHVREMTEWQERYQQSNIAREASIDSIARGMAELASVSGAPASPLQGIPVNVIHTAETASEAPAHAAAPGGAVGGVLVEITEADQPKCTNCKACYQDVSELFERTTIVVDGASKVVSRVISGASERVELTPDLVQRAARVADECDAEIIRFNPPVQD
jgi:pyruvate-ferredoxin/flavodoxin oxidoreductase